VAVLFSRNAVLRVFCAGVAGSRVSWLQLFSSAIVGQPFGDGIGQDEAQNRFAVLQV
jgi:TctA family transporter